MKPGEPKLLLFNANVKVYLEDYNFFPSFLYFVNFNELTGTSLGISDDWLLARIFYGQTYFFIKNQLNLNAQPQMGNHSKADSNKMESHML